MPLTHTSFTELLALKSILALTEQPILLFDSKENLLGTSSQVLCLFPSAESELSLADVLGSSLNDFRQWLTVVQANADRTIVEFEGYNVERENRHISWRAQAVFGKTDNFIGFCLVGTDYTHMDKLEFDLKKSVRLAEDQKMALDESSIVAITDQRGVIQYVNDTFCRVSGYERSDLIGKTHSVVKSSYHTPEFFHHLWRTIGQGKVWKGEIKNRTKLGEIYWVDTTIVPFVNESGKPYQYVAIRNDITEKKMMQEKLEKEQIRAVHAERMQGLGKLAAGIAHELGNPAASINAWLDVIEAQRERGHLDVEFFARMIPKVRKDAARIRDIIRGMLAYARDGSRDPFQLENPLLLVNQMIENCNYKLRAFNVTIEVSALNPYLSLECRSTEIAQMLVNFILNACDAIQSFDEKWIKIAVLDKRENIEFRIIDSGFGIPEDLLESIFNPFFTTKPVGMGTGLGLSIAKSIVDNHQGTISIDRACLNTCFVISLPKRQNLDQADANHDVFDTK
ncbi:MAG: PAS domain S-box protein [Chitinophagaceae bacterium]|nr:PAS domain S-box protein [Oligoflexus sp.]